MSMSDFQGHSFFESLQPVQGEQVFDTAFHLELDSAARTHGDVWS